MASIDSPREAFGDGSGASGRSVANLLVILRISLYVRLLRETIDCALELVGELPAFEIGEMACPSHADWAMHAGRQGQSPWGAKSQRVKSEFLQPVAGAIASEIAPSHPRTPASSHLSRCGIMIRDAPSDRRAGRAGGSGAADLHAGVGL